MAAIEIFRASGKYGWRLRTNSGAVFAGRSGVATEALAQADALNIGGQLAQALGKSLETPADITKLRADLAKATADLVTANSAVVSLQAEIVRLQAEIDRLSSPTVPPASNKWKVDFFSGIVLAGSVIKTVEVDALNFDWGTAGPGAPVPVDSFSVRATKTATTEAGLHRLTVKADDGVRVKVDNGAWVINKWLDQAATEYSADVTLTAGSHVVVVEYYEKTGFAVLSCSGLVKVQSTPPPVSNVIVAVDAGGSGGVF